MVPTIEVIEIIISMLMVNLREMKKDHIALRNEFFKAIPFVTVVVVLRCLRVTPLAL